jgi:hypothetical protein
MTWESALFSVGGIRSFSQKMCMGPKEVGPKEMGVPVTAVTEWRGTAGPPVGGR